MINAGDIWSTMGVSSTMGDIMSTMGVISSTKWDTQYRGGYHDACGGYHDACGGYHDARGRYHEYHRGVQ